MIKTETGEISDPALYVREERVKDWKKEFQLHDDYDTGFIKTKAFERIIDSPSDGIMRHLELKPNPTDVHYNAHGLKISVDYVVFLRFMASWIRRDPVEEEFTLRGTHLSSPKYRPESVRAGDITGDAQLESKEEDCA